MSIRKCPDLI